MASAKDTQAGDGLIVPDKIPGPDLSPESVNAAASDLTSSAKTIRTAATSIDTSWSALPASFIAPDAHIVYTAMTPASTSATTFGGKLDRVAKALTTFADGLDPIKKTFAGIKKDALEFLKDFDDENRVWLAATSTTKYQSDSHLSGSTTSTDSGAAGAAGSGAIGVTQAPVDPLTYLRGKGETARMHNGVVQIRAYWLESSWHVDRNNQLLDRAADAYAKVNALEVDCANAIGKERDDCLAPMKPVEAWQLKQSGENTVVLPWGHRVEENRNCGESFWWGLGNAGLSTLTGLGGLISYNPLTNGWGDWDHAGQSWTGMFAGIGTLVIGTNPVGMILAANGDPLAKRAVNDSTEMLKGLVAWDTWAKNPGEALGTVVFNIGTFLIPGAAEASGVLKGLTAGTKLDIIAGSLTKVERIGQKIADLIPSTDDIAKFIRGEGKTVDIDINLPKTDTPTIHGPHADGPAPIAHGPETGGHGPSESGHASGSDTGTSSSHGTNGHSGDSTDAGGHSAHGGSHADNGSTNGHESGSTNDASSGGGSGTNPDGHGNTSGGHNADQDNKPDVMDPKYDPDPHHHAGALPRAEGPMYSKDAAGDGWSKIPDENVSPKGFGSPHSDHGEVEPWYQKPQEVTDPDVQKLILHPEAPYGWDEHGIPLDKQGWDERYVLPNNPDGTPGGVRWPGNDGALNGTRVKYTSIDALLRDYPEFHSLDRLGGDRGDYLTVTGTPFEQRGLTPGHAGYEYNVYDIADRLPEGVTIEVSRIAPANGFPGGGWQIRFAREGASGSPFMRVMDLIKAGILR